MFNKLKKQVNYLTESDTHNLWLFNKMTESIKSLEARIDVLEKLDNKRYEDLRLVYEYLGVHKEIINETVLVEDDCICDECLDNEDNWETIKEFNKNNKKK